MVPYEAFLAEKPVVTTTDAGGPLEVVADRETGLVSSRRPQRSPRRARGCATTSTTRRRGGRPGKEIARRVSWDETIARLLGVRVAYYSPLPPERSGIADYSALLLPALEQLVEVEVVRRGRTRPVAADVALYHVGNDPEAHGWIVDALRRRPGVVVLHDFVLHHLVAGLTIGRKDGPRLPRRDGARRRHSGPACSAHGVLDGRVSPPWETRPDEFPLAGEVLANATGLIVHSHYVEERVLRAGYHGPIWRIPHPAWPTRSTCSRRRSTAGRSSAASAT